MKLRLLFGMLVFSILLSACQPGTVQPGKTDPPVQTGQPVKTEQPVVAQQTTGKAAQYQYIFQPPSTPPTAAVTLDETRAVEMVMPTSGGTLNATGADGTQYVLNIPGDALLEETKIRLIPAAVSGLPFGGEQTYAAQLEPEGLAFNNFVTLAITPAQEIPLKEQLFFGYQEAGKDVIFAPPVKDSQEIKIQLLHFSGYGVTKGLLADPETMRERLGGNAERRLQSLTAELLGSERQRQLLGGQEVDTSTLANDLEQLFNQYQKEVVDVRVAAAGESCAAGRLALQTVLGVERQKQLLGMGESSMDLFNQLMLTVSRVCLQEEYELCAQDHIIHRMVPVWLGFERQFQLLGGAEGAGYSEISKLAKELTQKCLTFDLVFESQSDFDDGGGGGFVSSVKSKVPLHFQPDALKIDGSSALINDPFTFIVDGCSVISNRGGSTLAVSSLVYITDTHSANDQLGYVRDFKLSFFPERTKEVFTVTCPDQPSYTSPTLGLWSGAFLVLHKDELVVEPNSASDAPPAAPAMPDMAALLAEAQSGVSMPSFSMPEGSGAGSAGYVMDDWEVTGGEFFAKKEWITQDPSIGLVERGTLKLYHHPGK